MLIYYSLLSMQLRFNLIRYKRKLCKMMQDKKIRIDVIVNLECEIN